HAQLRAARADQGAAAAAALGPDPPDARAVAAVAASDEVVAVAALRRWLRSASALDYPPDAAGVRRVLSVARGEHKATELAGGWRVARRDGRLRMEPPMTDDAGW
ncbi:MAG: hypothetical protein JJU45_12085, partial [Acidimicrobiia bacterium]|nr:hypothetical protein [Acidimicrobiia bacterium]